MFRWHTPQFFPHFFFRHHNILKAISQPWFTQGIQYKNKIKRYSRLPRLSDTRYLAKGSARDMWYKSSKATILHIPKQRHELEFEKQVSWKKVGFGLSFLCLSRLGLLLVHSIRPFQTYRKSITKTPKKSFIKILYKKTAFWFVRHHSKVLG